MSVLFFNSLHLKVNLDMHNSKYKYTVIKMYLLSQIQGSELRSIFIF